MEFRISYQEQQQAQPIMIGKKMWQSPTVQEAAAYQLVTECRTHKEVQRTKAFQPQIDTLTNTRCHLQCSRLQERPSQRQVRRSGCVNKPVPRQNTETVSITPWVFSFVRFWNSSQSCAHERRAMWPLLSLSTAQLSVVPHNKPNISFIVDRDFKAVHN